jgi:uncharacterized protein YukE
MTAPGGLPGLDVIVAKAAELGIDIADAVRKATMLMQTNPTAVQAGGERLNTVASGLDTDHQTMSRLGTDLAGGMNGQTAQAFQASHAALVDQSAGLSGVAKQIATEFGQIATAFQRGQQTVVTATGATAAALRMQQV